MAAAPGQAGCVPPAPGPAGPSRDRVPQGTTCELVGGRGQTTLEQTFVAQGVVLKARGYASEGITRCTLPHGETYESDWNQRALGPQGSRMLAAEVYYWAGRNPQMIRVQYGNFYREEPFRRVK